MTPTLVTSCTALPPRGPQSPWGGPAATDKIAPTIPTHGLPRQSFRRRGPQWGWQIQPGQGLDGTGLAGPALRFAHDAPAPRPGKAWSGVFLRLVPGIRRHG